MKRKNLTLALLAVCIGMAGCASSEDKQSAEEYTLRNTLGKHFLIGAAINPGQATGKDSLVEQIVRTNFNSVVAEGCMKMRAIHPEPGKYDFKDADSFMAFAERNDQIVIGHTLIWNSMLPDWFYKDDKGNDVSPDVLKERMREHISTVVGRYKGKIKGWDVVNEALNDDGTYRDCPFYRILGEEYIPLAFMYAHEADPGMELYYNDFNLNIEAKRNTVLKIVDDLRCRGIEVSAIGMQCHLWRGWPTVESVEKAIVDFKEHGLKVMITELDLSALPTRDDKIGANVNAKFEYGEDIDPYRDGLPDEVAEKWNDRMFSFFKMFLRHDDVITRVTTWGVTDDASWRNGWPIKGRTDYPLLFGRDRKPKPVVDSIIKTVLALEKINGELN